MKNIYFTFLLCLIHMAIFAQDKKSESSRYNWQTFDDMPAERLISEEKHKLGLAANDGLEIKSQEIDNLMIAHTRYIQTHNGVAIDGAQYVLHQSADKLWGNGRLVYGITANENPALSEDAALENALAWFSAESYHWEDPAKEDLIKWITNDPTASYYPHGELVYAEEKFSQKGANYQLYWKFDINATGEKLREYVYVNAMTGMVEYSQDAICYSSAEGIPNEFPAEGTANESPTEGIANEIPAEGIADTYYYGQQTIITEQVGQNSYILLDETRGGGICTMDLGLTPPSYDAGTQIEDADNIWDSPDMAGPTAHWCAEMTYDFYLDRYDRNSFDDNGAKMLTYVHGGLNGNTCIPFGFFSGLYVAIGDGPGCSNPGYYLEHVGHEFTHGVTAHSSALEGGERAGELSESFSNIMGTAIEFYADPDNATWEFNATIPYDMSDPNAFPFQAPDTYLGNYWVEVGDPGYDPHINATVQDYWYYLLSDGGSGVNDNGDSYAVQGIGIEAATDIAYRNLTLYLVPSTTFEDARQGSILAAIDLYGECSNEVIQVINAWHAVGLGLGPDEYSDDLSLERIVSPSKDCGLTNNEILEVEFQYHATGCEGGIEVGTEIEMTYQIDSETAISEMWIVDEDLVEGETYSYSFLEPISLPIVGVTINLSVWMDYAADGIPFNNQLLDYEIGLKQALTDNAITFENGTDPEAYYYVHNGVNAVAEITSVAANTGAKGFSMSSGTGSPGVISADTSLTFDGKIDRISKLCFCVDAQLWDNVTVNFDMKQTRSMLYNHFWGTDSAEFVSSTRMLVNGAQFGGQFHPATYLNDPYQTHVYSLDQFDLAGTTFEFCFESINSVNDEVDSPFFPYDSDGDNTYLDNILFSNVPVWDCPDLSLNIGDACDDGDPNTINEIINEDCNCVGTISVPANDLCENSELLNVNLPGDCDGNETLGTTSGATSEGLVVLCESFNPEVFYTFNSGAYSSVQTNISQITATYLVFSLLEGGCDGPLIDCYPVPSDVPIPVTPFTDYTVTISSNIIFFNSGSFSICVEGIYDCPLLSANIGDACDDGNPNTINDVVNADCNCTGEEPDSGSLSGTADWNSNCGDRGLTVDLYAPGTSTLLYSYATSIDANGDFDLGDGIAAGNYDIYANLDGSLANGYLNETISLGVNTLLLGSFIPGDLNNDNGINISDFSLLNVSFGSSEGDANFNFLADMNCDENINIIDVSILNIGFGMVGAQP